MLSAACESSISVSSLCLHVCLSLFRLCFFSHLFCFGIFLERLATTVYHAVSMHDFARYYPCAPRAASTYILHSAALAISLRDLPSGSLCSPSGLAAGGRHQTLVPNRTQPNHPPDWGLGAVDAAYGHDKLRVRPPQPDGYRYRPWIYKDYSKTEVFYKTKKHSAIPAKSNEFSALNSEQIP